MLLLDKLAVRIIRFVAILKSPLSPFSIFITLVAKVTAVILVLLLSAASPFDSSAWTNSIIAAAPSYHATLLLFLVETCRWYTSRSWWCSEVIRSNSRGNRWRVSSFDVCNVGRPSCGAESRIIENSRIDIDKTFTNTIFDVRQI